jgi:hypothetical protein
MKARVDLCNSWSAGLHIVAGQWHKIVATSSLPSTPTMPSPLSSAKQRPQLAMDPTVSFSSTSSGSSDANDNDDDGHDVPSSLVETPFTVQADVYGQFHPLESPALLAQRLAELDAALCALMTMRAHDDRSNHHKQSKSSSGITSTIVALREAQTANPMLFRDEALRLMFLRAECFRVQVRASWRVSCRAPSVFLNSCFPIACVKKCKTAGCRAALWQVLGAADRAVRPRRSLSHEHWPRRGKCGVLAARGGDVDPPTR